MKRLFVCALVFVSAAFLFSKDSKEKLPYAINGIIGENEESSSNQKTLELSFYNLSKKEISGFTAVMFIFNQEGNSVLKNKNSLVLKFEEMVLPGEDLTLYVDLNSYIYDTEDESYEIEYLYVSIIEYCDGSYWYDPFGLKRF